MPFGVTQVPGATNDSKDDLDALLKSSSSPKSGEGGQQALYNEVTKLGGSAEDIDVSFKKTTRGLNQALEVVTSVTQKTSGVLRQLGETWPRHHKTYIDLLLKSRRIATHSRAVATDFAENFLPVLQGDYSIDAKKKEIAHHLKELEQERMHSQELLDGFKRLLEPVAYFQVAVSYQDVSKSLEENLTGDIAIIQTKLGMFELVWQCVVADLNELEKHLERMTTVKTKILFNEGIERATTIYKTIAHALYLYIQGLCNFMPDRRSAPAPTPPPTPPFISHPSQLPFMCISSPVFESWTQGDLTRVEQLLNEEIIRPTNTFSLARALAYRALVRTRSKHWDTAVDDANRSIKVERSIIGYIAHAIALAGSGDYESAMEVFDLVLSIGLPIGGNLLLLVKAIILFQHGQYDGAISRVDRLIDTVDHDKSPYMTVGAQMFLLREAASVGGGDHERAVELFKRAKEAIPVQKGPYLIIISLIFSWNFDRLSTEIQLALSKAMYTMVDTLGEGALTTEMIAGWDPAIVETCIIAFESSGDEAARSNDRNRAISRYSAALFLNPPKPAGILVKRSTARGVLGLWEDALKDADEAIKEDSSSPWGYERRYAALCGLQRYDDAMSSFVHMHSLIESSPDPDACQLVKKYISPTQSEMVIDNVVREVSKISPLVLIDIKSGRLCNEQERARIFKSEPEFKGLVYSTMTQALDDGRIQQVVEAFFRYVTLSHVWEGNEPSFQDVNQAGSVWGLGSSLLNDKLRGFCGVVRTDGYRWAWSDTCCIDKTISTVLNQSLKMMYKWYEASAATFVFLTDVTGRGLKDSKWLTRAWTSQELLAPIVIRFYSRDWQPYLGNPQPNHKEVPEIMEELADAIGVARDIITAFDHDSLGVREKLRLASTRKATVLEDIAYSLIGIFKSDIRPEYGERYAALGHLLEEIVARSGEVTVLAWNGMSSSYNSCLPVSLEVYSQPPGSLPPITDTDMDERVAGLRNTLSQADAAFIHDQVTRLPPARFANRRLHLPCIIFTVRRIGVQDWGSRGNRYRAKVSGIGDVEFWTSDKLPVAEPRKLIFVHPWIRELRDPHDGYTWGRTTDDDDDTADFECEDDPDAPTSPLHAVPNAVMDDYTRALRLVVRLQQPFHTLLLEQQPNGEFKRVATKCEIVIPGIKRPHTFSKDVQTGVVEVL